MKKVLRIYFASNLHFTALLIVISALLQASCGHEGAVSYSSITKNSTNTSVVKYAVYAVDCNTLASDVTITTVAAQATWSADGKIVSESFTPKAVTIPVYSVVKWHNNDVPGETAPAGTWNGYNIYSEGWIITDSSSSATSTASSWIGPDQSFCLQFGTSGTYQYHWDLKTGAIGEITVVGP